MFRVLLSRALDLVFRRRRDERLREEIQAHLDQLTDEFVARGMTREDAQLAARRAFGGVDQVKAVYRDQRGLPVVDALTQDLRFAVRRLRRDRGFAITAVLVLGLGIGVNNMLFTILNAHTIRGLPIDRVDRVVYVSTFDDRTPDRGLSYPDFEDLRSAAQGVVSLAAFSGGPVVVGGDGHAPERLDGAYVTENAFGLLGIRPVLGRGFSGEDDKPGAQAVALLGVGAWASRYGGDRAIVGRSIQVNSAPAVVVGIMPERSGFPSTAEVWLPLAQMPGLAAQKRDVKTLRVFGRVQDGASVADARTQIEAIAQRLSRDHPDTNTNVRARVVPINERFLGRLTDPAWLAFMTAGCLVVLISCANVANLVLASSTRRAREIAIRAALGANRRRVLRQLLIEGVVLATIGGAVGLGLAMAGARLFRSAIPENVLPYWFDYSFDVRVFAALAGVSLSTVFLFALLPALHASKGDVTRVLKDGGAAGTSRRGTQRWATTFLAAEFGLAVVLLAHLVMGLRSSAPSVQSDDAIDSEQVLTAVVTLPVEAYRSADQRIDFHRRLHERLRANPAIATVSTASVLPLQSAAEDRIEIEGRPRTDGEPPPPVRTVLIAPRYFETFGLTLTRGRDFAEDDGARGERHAIVNQDLTEKLFGGQDPIGQRISVASQDTAATPNWFTIVGVAPDIRQRPVPNVEPVVYLPYRGAPPTTSLLVRARGEGANLAPLLRQEVQAFDPNLPLYRIRTMAQAIRDARWNARLSARLILVLTIIAVGLSIVGLYAVTAYGISQHTHEIGLRLALGAQTRQVAAMIGRRVMAQLAIGLMTGVVCTMLWDRTFSGGPGIRVTDPVSLFIVATILAVASVIACAVPIRRATRLDPLTAIRHD